MNEPLKGKGHWNGNWTNVEWKKLSFWNGAIMWWGGGLTLALMLGICKWLEGRMSPISISTINCILPTVAFTLALQLTRHRVFRRMEKIPVPQPEPIPSVKIGLTVMIVGNDSMREEYRRSFGNRVGMIIVSNQAERSELEGFHPDLCIASQHKMGSDVQSYLADAANRGIFEIEWVD